LYHGYRRLSTAAAAISDDGRHSQYPHLFTPLDLGPDIEPLSNRVIMGSMHCGLEGHAIPKPLSYLMRMASDEPSSSPHDKTTAKFSHDEEWAAYFAERARGGVSLMVTGGISPNARGVLTPFGSKLTSSTEVPYHQTVTKAVHEANPKSKILLQILHAGRYSVHPFLAAPSAVKSPLGPFTPKAMSRAEVLSTVQDFVHTAQLARDAGYDGVEIMGSEGYLIHQFLCPKTNQRKDDYGDTYANRMRFPLEIVHEMRATLPPNFIIMFRLSMLDLVDNTSTWDEVVQLAEELQLAGVTIINTGIGWHEARVPTITTCVPRGAFTWITQQMKERLGNKTPLCTTNRINTPEKVEHVLASGQADLVSMARPFLADPNFIQKAYEGVHNEINTCIACNQACLDHVFAGKRASCLVNPRACYELEMPPIVDSSSTIKESSHFKKSDNKMNVVERTTQPKQVAVIGAGPAGLATATAFAALGHNVTLYDKQQAIGGQFNMAKRIPGKREFYETIRYFDTMMNKYGVKRCLQTVIESVADFGDVTPDVLVLATGVLPRTPPIPNIYKHPKIVSYVDVLTNNVEVGEKVAIIGAGGIGFDVAEYLLHSEGWDANDRLPKGEHEEAKEVDEFFQEWDVGKKKWSIEDTKTNRGGLIPPEQRQSRPPKRKITLMQRKPGKVGATLGKTTGWIHRAQLVKGNVEQLAGCSYDKFDEDGNLHITIKDKKTGTTEKRVIEVDHVVVCAGQEKCDALVEPLTKQLAASGGQTFVVGGAYEAGELDAKRAINMGTRLAYAVHKHGTDGTKEAILQEVVGHRPLEDEELLVKMLNRLSGKR
jgi:2,4-dienoyl-CoA reductase (NADPH2)